MKFFINFKNELVYHVMKMKKVIKVHFKVKSIKNEAFHREDITFSPIGVYCTTGVL